MWSFLQKIGLALGIGVVGYAATKPSPAQASLPSSTQRVNTQDTRSLAYRIMQAESSGNPNAKASTSSASGLYQFTDGTWRLVVAKWGKQTGIALKDKNDPKAQRVMFDLLLEDNRQGLKRLLGRNPTDAELYAAHFAGVSDAAKMIKNPSANAANLLPSAARSNKTIFFTSDGRARSSREVLQILANKVA